MASTINVSDYVLLVADGTRIADDGVKLLSRHMGIADYIVKL